MKLDDAGSKPGIIMAAEGRKIGYPLCSNGICIGYTALVTNVKKMALRSNIVTNIAS